MRGRDTTDSIRTDRTYWAVKYGMGERQLMWLAENALMTLPAGWCAVVMHHIPVAEIVSGESGVPQTFAPWRSLLEAYQSRGVATVGGRKFDFSSAQGRILCSLTGHEHAERQTYRNGLWHITEPCDAAYSDYIVGSSPWCAGLPKKEKGTIFEQTFDAIHIDRKNNVLHFTRIGGGADRTIRLNHDAIDVGDSLALAKNGAAWGCYDADRAGKKPNPANKYQSFFRYFNDVAEISSSQTLVAKKAFSSNEKALSMRETNGFIKVVADKNTHKILGAIVFGPQGSVLIEELSLALEMGLKLEDIALSIHAHPTLSELVMETCKLALGLAFDK